MKLTDTEISLADFCIETALAKGASAARASLSKAVTDSYATLDGTLDKVTHAADRSIFLHLFVDGRYGTYSTNMLERKEIDAFVTQAIESTRLLAPDPSRGLPPLELCPTGALSGTELGLYDSAYESMTAQQRLDMATGARMPKDSEEYSVLSCESEYSDNIDDNYIADSQGFRGRHLETSFSVCSEITIADRQGRRYSAYWWEASPRRDGILRPGENPIEACTAIALEKAKAQIGAGRSRGGARNMVVDRTVASRLVAPLLNALYGSSIQQKNSFLADYLGKKVFSENLTIVDLPHRSGQAGARLFDTEGVATRERTIIDRGVVQTFFLDTSSARKLSMEQTVEGPSVPVLMSCPCNNGEIDLNLQRILKECGRGIYVTGFNGGNCNSATGDFSYGVEGFTFSRGKIVHPVHGMLITGNMKELWNNLVMAGNDARSCSRWQIPTLAFRNVNFSA